MTSTTKAGGRRPYARRLPMPQRREQLLDATLRLINRDGYQAVSMEAIAREAGVTKPVVYGAFENLGALVSTLHERQQARGISQLLDAMPTEQGLGIDEFVGRTIRAWIGAVRADPDTWGPVLLARGGTPDIVWQGIEHGKEVLREQLTGLLSSIGVSGAVDPGLFAHTLVATAYHFGRLLLTDPDDVDVDRLVSTMQALVAAATRG